MIERARVQRIAERVLRHVDELGLPPPDFEGCPGLEATIASLLDGEGLTDDECFRFVTCMEHVDPFLAEDAALLQMGIIVSRARIRRGVPADRMGDAVSFRSVKLEPEVG